MLPCYKSDDFVLTYRLPPEKLNCGDVVVIDHNYFGIIIKRIMQIDASAVLTLVGDNWACSTDSETLGVVNSEQVLGKVIFHLAMPC